MGYLIPLPIQKYIYEHDQIIEKIMTWSIAIWPILMLAIGLLIGEVYTETEKALGIVFILLGVFSAATLNYLSKRGEYKLFSHLF